MKFSFRGVYKLEGVRLTINLLHKHLNKKSQRSIQQGNHIVRKSRQRGSSERRSNICGAVVADKSTGLSNRRSNPQSVCQWSYIYIYSIYFLPIDTLCIWYIYVHIFSFCFDLICMVSLGVFCISFCLYRQLLFFLLLLSIIFGMGALCKIFCGLSKFLKNLVVVVVAFVYKQTVFLFFLFVAQINTSSINYPTRETAVRLSQCARERDGRFEPHFGLHCVRFSLARFI